MLHVNLEGIQPVCRLEKGHEGVIRTSAWNMETKSLVTGGEDSILCFWSVEGPAAPPAKVNKV